MLIPFELCSKQVCAKHREIEAKHYFAFNFPYLLSCSPGGMLDITHLHSLSTEHLSVTPYFCFREYSEQKVNFLRRAECHLQKNKSFSCVHHGGSRTLLLSFQCSKCQVLPHQDKTVESNQQSSVPVRSPCAQLSSGVSTLLISLTEVILIFSPTIIWILFIAEISALRPEGFSLSCSICWTWLVLHDSCIGFSCWEIPISMSRLPFERGSLWRDTQGFCQSSASFQQLVSRFQDWARALTHHSLSSSPVVSRSFKGLKMQQQQDSPRLQDWYEGFLLFCCLILM